MELKNTQHLPKPVKDAYIPFAKRLIALHGDNLSSIFLYGSATGANYIPKCSDINSVMVVKKIGFETLQKSLKLIASVRAKRIIAPLILTEAHIHSSRDVFPIEFLDMKDNSVVIFGTDFLKDLQIEGEHVRLFCEQQIKGKLIRIRQAYLEVGLKRRGTELLLRESLNSLIPVFRSLLKVKAVLVPADKKELLKKIGDVFALDTHVMVAIWEEKKNDERICGRDAREAFGDYIQVLERLAEAVDQL